MTYPSEPFAIGQPLLMQFDRISPRNEQQQGNRDAAFFCKGRSRVKLILLGDSDAVDENVIELERRGYCDSYAWTPPLIVRENAPPIQPLPGELMRFYQRWYPATGLRLPL